MEEKFLQEEGPGAEKNLLPLTSRDSNSLPEERAFARFDAARLKGHYGFGEAERLKSKKKIEKLFKEGKAISNKGFTLVYLPLQLNSLYPVQAGFSVPKKCFKHAVDRNRIKRLMR